MCQDDGAPTLAHPPRPPAVSLPQSLELIRPSASDRTTSDPAPEPPDATLAPQPAIPSDAIAQPVTLTTLNTRGMHTSLVDLLHTMERTQPDILSLTETKHSHIKSIWRHTLTGYKLVHHPPPLNPDTGRRSGGVILAIRTSHYRSITQLSAPEALRPHLAAAVLTPYIGSPTLVIGAYMPQLNTPDSRNIYSDTIAWILQTVRSYKNSTGVQSYVGGDFQATTAPDSRSYHELLHPLTDELQHLTNPRNCTYQPANTPIDHWFVGKQQSPETILHPKQRIITSAYSDHSSLSVQVPPKATGLYVRACTNTQPTPQQTADRLKFVLPLTEHHLAQYRCGNAQLHESARTLQDRLNHAELEASITTHDVDSICQELLELLQQHYDLAATIWPTIRHPQQQKTTTTSASTPPGTKTGLPLSRADRRQMDRLTSLRNHCHNLARRYEDEEQITHDTAFESLQQQARTTLQLQLDDLDPQPLSFREIKTTCKKQLAELLRRAGKKARDIKLEKNNKSYDANPKLFHKAIKTAAGLLPKSKDQPKLRAVHQPHTNEPSTDPATVLRTVQDHFAKELQRTTPDDMDSPPWENPENPDNYTLATNSYGSS